MLLTYRDIAHRDAGVNVVNGFPTDDQFLIWIYVFIYCFAKLIHDLVYTF